MSNLVINPLKPLARRYTRLLAVPLALFSVSCAASETVEPSVRAPYVQTILIFFDSDKCPTGVNVNELNATRDNPPTKIVWMDSKVASTPPDPDPADFEIIFSPFQGPSIGSQNGVSKGPTTIIDTTPSVNYKYTIHGTDCADPAKQNYDPYIRVL